MGQLTKEFCESILRTNGPDAKGKHHPLTVWEQTQLARAWLALHESAAPEAARTMDPTNWNPDPDTGSFEFASPEEAKRAEGIINRMMRESFVNGRNVAIEECARVCDILSGLSVQGWGRKSTTAARKCASEIRDLKLPPPPQESGK